MLDMLMVPIGRYFPKKLRLVISIDLLIIDHLVDHVPIFGIENE
jgi:hypothetical protein